MHLIGRHQPNAGMVMLLIVPIEEAAAERLGILDAAEARWELRLIFHGFEVAFRERIVIGGVRPAVGFVDAEIGQQQAALERERQLASEIAHELRTPLSSIALQAASLRGPLGAQAHEAALLQIYARLRPGNPPQVDKAKALFRAAEEAVRFASAAKRGQ